MTKQEAIELLEATRRDLERRVEAYEMKENNND